MAIPTSHSVRPPPVCSGTDSVTGGGPAMVSGTAEVAGALVVFSGAAELDVVGAVVLEVTGDGSGRPFTRS